MGIFSHIDRSTENVYYIIVWDENMEISDCIYKDLIFEDKDDALELCDELNKDSSEVEYEVFDAIFNKKK